MGKMGNQMFSFPLISDLWLFLVELWTVPAAGFILVIRLVDVVDSDSVAVVTHRHRLLTLFRRRPRGPSSCRRSGLASNSFFSVFLLLLLICLEGESTLLFGEDR